jgi:hypothetical protein
MSCPLGQVCDKICKHNWVASAIKGDLCLSIIEHFADFAMVIKPTDEASRRFSDFSGKYINSEVVAENQLKLCIMSAKSSSLMYCTYLMSPA